MYYMRTRSLDFRKVGIAFLLFAVVSMMLLAFSGAFTYGSNAIMALYFEGVISENSAVVSLTALGIPSGIVTGYLLSTAGYVAFEQGALTIFLRYTILDLLGWWGWLILAAIAATAV